MNYQENLRKILPLALAALGVSLLLHAFAWLTSKIAGRQTGFDLAAEQLFHYPRSVSGVLAFFAAVLLLLCLTVFFEGWPPAAWTRKKIVLPSLGIAEHMLILVAGVFVAWTLLEPMPSWNRVVATAISTAILLVFASVCSVVATFFEGDYEAFSNRWGKGFSLLILSIAAGIAAAAYHDLLELG